MYQEVKDNFLFTTDASLLDLEVIYSFISTSYWANGVTKNIVEKSVKNSLCFAVYDIEQEKKQIGFARVITDLATFAYMADVFIIDSYQGKGLGKQLIKFILDYPDFKTLRRFLLATRTAHSLYEKFGFSPVKNPENFMAIHKPDIYRLKS